jgi:hypothetical protein
MPSAPSEAAIAEIVREVLDKDFDKSLIVDVSVQGRFEDDGEFVRIQVTLEGKPKDWDTKVIASAVRLVRPRLVEIGEFAFPLFSFLTVSDAKYRAPA